MAENSLPIDSKISQALLRRMFRYNPTTGHLTWKERPQGPSWWNRRYAGKVAGHRHESSGYVLVKYKQKLYLAHRLIWLLVHGRMPLGEIDHINRNPQDNRLVNLRDVSRSENMRNCAVSKRVGVGVSQIRRSGRWRAYITLNGKPKHVGSFDTRDQAIKARKEAMKAQNKG